MTLNKTIKGRLNSVNKGRCIKKSQKSEIFDDYQKFQFEKFLKPEVV